MFANILLLFHLAKTFRILSNDLLSLPETYVIQFYYWIIDLILVSI